GAPRLLSAAIDRPITGSRWSRDGRAIAGVEADDMRQYPVLVHADGRIERVPCDLAVVDAVVTRADGALAVVGGSTEHPPELYTVAGKVTRRLTRHNAWADSVTFAT